MDEKLLTASELHHKNENFSVSYFLADLRRDRFSAYALSDEVEKMIANYDGRNTPENYLCISALVLNLFMDGELEKAQKIIDSIPDEGYYLHFLKIGLQLVNPLISWKEFIKHLNYLKSKKVSLKCFINSFQLIKGFTS